MEEAKDFNKYTSKVNFAPITDFVQIGRAHV